MKVLNIDALCEQSARSVTLNGKTHLVKEFSVQDFIDITNETQKLAEKENPTLEDQISMMVKVIRRGIPTLTEKEIRAMPSQYLRKIADFVRDGEDEDAERAVDTSDNKTAQGNA